MKHLETAIAKRLERAATHSFEAPQNLKEQKKLYKQFGVTYFVNHKEAMAYAKGKGFKVIDRSRGADAENGPGPDDLDFFYEVTDKAGNTVGLISGYANEGEAWICPTAQHYKKWEAYQHGHEASVQTTASASEDEWWKSLDKKQQDAYIKKHPNSKYAKNAKTAKGKGAGLLPKPSKPKKDSQPVKYKDSWSDADEKKLLAKKAELKKWDANYKEANDPKERREQERFRENLATDIVVLEIKKRKASTPLDPAEERKKAQELKEYKEKMRRIGKEKNLPMYD